MKLTFTPKAGFAGPPIPWPACDHDEKDPIVATEKVASGFFAEVVSRPKQSDKTEGGDGTT
ncbi:MAG TPA: hypothetical protein DCP69_00730 [Candidatus Omnitrophica bacterium]|nr:hypothetical protein [Candidatus Omnitrophota bacterium]